jgi:hypothetical protein
MMTRKPPVRKQKSPGSWGTPAKLSPDLQAKIGEKLKEMHDDVIRQGVPPRFAELLARLDQPADEKSK